MNQSTVGNFLNKTGRHKHVNYDSVNDRKQFESNRDYQKIYIKVTLCYTFHIFKQLRYV